MPASESAESHRLVSLDVFRGITIAGMILVNNPGDGRYRSAPLAHAHWHGWTPTDLIFPFFLFIVGVAMTFSFARRRALGHSSVRLFEQVLRRSLIIFLLGLTMHGFPDWRLIGPCAMAIAGLVVLFVDEPPLGLGRTRAGTIRKIVAVAALSGAASWCALDFAYFQASTLRIPGVLQRIACCYLAASIIVMFFGLRGRFLWIVGLLAGYWLIVALVHPPAGFSATVIGTEGLLHEWIDVCAFGDHLYFQRPDPLGLLSTLPAIATTIMGVLVGSWLRARRNPVEKVVGMFLAANVLLVAGSAMGHWFPINKKLWTSSYAVFTAGMALHFLAMCYWLVDVKRFRRWSLPFVIFGTNAIAVYFASSLFARTLSIWKFSLADGQPVSVKQWIFENVFACWAGPYGGSLGYAVCYVAVWGLLTSLLYRRRIFIKV